MAGCLDLGVLIKKKKEGQVQGKFRRKEKEKVQVVGSPAD